MIRTAAAGLGLFGVLLVIGTGCDSSDDTYVNKPLFSIDGESYNKKYTCNRSFDGGPPSCPDLNETDVIQFDAIGGGVFDVRYVPDTGFVYTGTFTGLVFNWTAASPDGYTESGSWAFSSSGDGFSGPSTYVADDFSYSGVCNTTGSIVPNVPSDPPLPTGCP